MCYTKREMQVNGGFTSWIFIYLPFALTYALFNPNEVLATSYSMFWIPLLYCSANVHTIPKIWMVLWGTDRCSTVICHCHQEFVHICFCALTHNFPNHMYKSCKDCNRKIRLDNTKILTKTFHQRTYEKINSFHFKFYQIQNFSFSVFQFCLIIPTTEFIANVQCHWQFWGTVWRCHIQVGKDLYFAGN